MNSLLFGANIDPAISAFDVAQVAEETGLDFALVQDHPYNKMHLDTWTFLSAVAARTNRIHIGTNVANVPLRTPAMLAKMAASLDVISGGRVELGIGAGRRCNEGAGDGEGERLGAKLGERTEHERSPGKWRHWPPGQIVRI
jgi:alkanesulfonate monooxygenase SsuD/methylene tetrahydromethanopterin reductase-like flavin-dependent oxidoreductase (luciferase family)